MYNYYQDKIDATYRNDQMRKAENERMAQACKEEKQTSHFFNNVVKAFNKIAEKATTVAASNDVKPSLDVQKHAHVS